MRFLIFVFAASLLLAQEAIAMNRSEMKPLVVILMGPPGSGKGTHASPLSQYLGLPHISTGDLFREHMRTSSPLGIKAQSYINKGNLVPDELVLDMLFDRVKKEDCRNGYILDGFPRTIPQAQALEKKLHNCRVAVLHFHLDDSIIVERVTGRIACKDCGRPFHQIYDPPKQTLICDYCGGNLIQREDDKEAIIRKRLEVYRKETEPLVAYFSRQENVLYEIDSENEKELVFQQVLESLPISLSSN